MNVTDLMLRDTERYIAAGRKRLEQLNGLVRENEPEHACERIEYAPPVSKAVLKRRERMRRNVARWRKRNPERAHAISVRYQQRRKVRGEA